MEEPFVHLKDVPGSHPLILTAHLQHRPVVIQGPKGTYTEADRSYQSQMCLGSVCTPQGIALFHVLYLYQRAEIAGREMSAGKTF